MTTPLTSSLQPSHWRQSDSSTVSAIGSFVLQLAVGAFVSLIQRFIEFRFGTAWSLLAPALDGVFRAIGSIQLGIDPAPPMRLLESGSSPLETTLGAEVALGHPNLPFDKDFDKLADDVIRAYALLGCILIAFSTGVWLMIRHSAQVEDAPPSSIVIVPQTNGHAHSSSGEKRHRSKSKRRSTRRREDFRSNDSQGPKSDTESDLTGDDDDDDDDDDPPPPPPGSGSEFYSDDDDDPRFWKIVGGNFILGSILMGVWKVIRRLRWARGRSSEYGSKDISRTVTIELDKYQSEWDVLEGRYGSPKRSAFMPSSTAKLNILWSTLGLPAILSVGQHPASPSAAGANSAGRMRTWLKRCLANVGMAKEGKGRGRIVRIDVSKMTQRLRELSYEFVETSGLMVLAMIFAFPFVVPYIGLEFYADEAIEKSTESQECSVGANANMELKTHVDDVINDAVKRLEDDVEGREVIDPAMKDEGEPPLQLPHREQDDEDGFVYLNERVYATISPATPTQHDIVEVVEPIDGCPLIEECEVSGERIDGFEQDSIDTGSLILRDSMGDLLDINPLDSSASEACVNLMDSTPDVGEILTMLLGGNDDDGVELVAELIQMIFSNHSYDSVQEMEVTELEDEQLSDVGSYITADDSELGLRPNIDEDEMESIHEQPDPCRGPAHLSSSEANGLTNVYERYSDQELSSCFDDRTTEHDVHHVIPVLPGNFPGVPLWTPHNRWSQPDWPRGRLGEREREHLFPSDAAAFGLPRSGLKFESASVTENISGRAYLIPPQACGKVFPRSPPGGKLRLRERLMNDEEDIDME